MFGQNYWIVVRSTHQSKGFDFFVKLSTRSNDDAMHKTTIFLHNTTG